MGEAVVGVRRRQVEAQVCQGPEAAIVGEENVDDEREKAVAAAVDMVAASARRGVVTLCASVAHIIRKNFRLQQQVAELEGRLRQLETLAGLPETSVTFTQCQEYSAGIEGPEYSRTNSHECSSATSQCPSSAESLPESPQSQRCGSAPPPYPRPYQCHEPALRKASDPEGGTGFLRGHTRASTGNLSHGGPRASSFVRRKYSSISLRRMRRTPTTLTTYAGRQGRTAGGSSRSSTASLEQQQAGNSNTSSKSCVVTVAEVYSSPDTTTTTINTSTSSTEGDAVKLLAQKLTNMLQEDTSGPQDNTDNLVLCAPHPLAGCECVVCLQLSTHPDVLPYEIITDEGSLLPRGSTVLVSGQRVGTVVYFGHCKHQSKGPGTPQAPQKASSAQPLYQQLPLLPAPGSCDTPSDAALRSVSSPIGVTVVLWPPDEGEVFVPLNDVICQLDDEGSPGSPDEQSTLVEEEYNKRQTSDEEHTLTNTHRDSMDLDHTLTDPHDSPRGMPERGHVTEDLLPPTRGMPEREHVAKASLPPVEDVNALEIREKPSKDPLLRPVSVSHRSYESLEEDIKTAQAMEHEINTILADKGGKPDIAPKPHVLTRLNSIDTALRRTHTTEVNLSLPASPRHTRLRGESGDGPELHHLDSNKVKLQFGDTWDSGCYMSVGRHSSECSEQFSDFESEYGSAPWASSLEDALDTVWKKHRQRDCGNSLTPTHSPFTRRQPTDTFFVDREIELQDYKTHKQARDDAIG